MLEFCEVSIKTADVEIENNELIIGDESFPFTHYLSVNRSVPEQMTIKFRSSTEDGDKIAYDTVVTHGTAAENEALWEHIKRELES